MLRARRRGVHGSTWPGFVDAMTGLLLVLMFVLTIFTVVQFTLRDQISGQQSRLDELALEIASLTDALGLSRSREEGLAGDLAALRAEGDRQATLIDELTRERDARAADLTEAQARITDFESQVAALILDRDDARERVAALEVRTAEQASEAEALNLALASAREEMDVQAEQARLAAARREALELLIQDLEADAAAQGEALSQAESALSEAEAQRLADAAAAEALRERLEGSQAELTAMTLALEEERRAAEETLTLLAAAEAARDDLDIELAAAVLARQEAEAQASEAEAQTESIRQEAEAAREALEAAGSSDRDLRERLARALERLAAAEAGETEAMTEAERQAALLAAAQAQLAQEEALSAESLREVAALNAQVSELRDQVGTLQALLDVAEEADEVAQVQIESLGQELNTALARVAAEERRRRELEEAERLRLEEEAERLAAEAQDLATYRSEFFGKMRQLVEGRAGVEVVGDRFVFSSEVLFPPGSDQLSPQGRAQISRVADLLREIAAEVPPGIDWVIQVDGHTDSVPIASTRFADNWELSQARALSVVRQMSETEGIPPERLSANGFGEFQPIDTSGTPEGMARNRRIEIKLTER